MGCIGQSKVTINEFLSQTVGLIFSAFGAAHNELIPLGVLGRG
jgi:hypothetical protein